MHTKGRFALKIPYRNISLDILGIFPIFLPKGARLLALKSLTLGNAAQTADGRQAGHRMFNIVQEIFCNI
jgi:hypothetical protein